MRQVYMIMALAALLLATSCRNSVETFSYADSVERSELFKVRAGGRPQTVITTMEPDICIFGCRGEVKVEVDIPDSVYRIDVRPLSIDFRKEVRNGILSITMGPKQKAVIEFNNNIDKPLFIFADPIDDTKPSKKDPKVHYFEAGKDYDAGEIGMGEGETVYLEGGAFVRGQIRAEGAEDITISGSGVLDSRMNDTNAIRLVKCRNARIEGLTALNRKRWTTYIAECDGVLLDNYKLSAEYNPIQPRGLENDGIDFISSSNARAVHCFAYCHDDPYCIKTEVLGHSGPARNIEFEDCIAWNYKGGNSMELGYAVSNEISNVSYRQIYSIHRRNNFRCRRSGDITIHNAGRSNIHNISYEDIYLEEADNFTFQMEIFDNKNSKTAYGYDYTPGSIRNVRLKNIYVYYDQEWFGSQFLGYDENHRIEDVVIDGVYVRGERITDPAKLNFKIVNADVTLK